MRVPDDLAANVAGYGGAAGRAWLASLPATVEALAAQWSLDVGPAFQPSGMTSLALSCVRDGEPCVLKVRFPEPGVRLTEAAALRHYGGAAAVRLLAEDTDRTALLLEACAPGSPLSAEPDDVAAAVVADLLGELWAPPEDGHPFGSLRAKGERWLGAIRGVDLADRAVGVLRDLLADPQPDVVLHADLHAANVLRAERRPWLAVDPKGLVGERAYDCAALLRDRATPDTVGRRLATVVDRLGVDRERVRGWALAQAVEGQVWCLRVGDVAAASGFGEAARLIAAL